MESIPISKFEASCTMIVARVQRTGRSIVITRRGKPLAELVSPTPPVRPDAWLGSLEGTLEIHGDIVEAPAIGPEAWEALNCAVAAGHAHSAVEPGVDETTAPARKGRARKAR